MINLFFICVTPCQLTPKKVQETIFKIMVSIAEQKLLENHRKNQKRKRKRHFSARDAARCVAYARRDGANDVELLKYLFYAFGLGNAPEAIAKTVMIFSTSIALGAVIGVCKGIKYFIKGAKLVFDSDLSIIPSGVMDFIIKHILRLERDQLPTYGVFLLWFGAIETTMSAIILFFTSLADNLFYASFMQKIADHKLQTPLKLKFTPPSIDFGLWEGEDEETITKSQAMLDVTNEITGSNFTLSDYLK
jgi:hypothetical protein